MYTHMVNTCADSSKSQFKILQHNTRAAINWENFSHLMKSHKERRKHDFSGNEIFHRLTISMSLKLDIRLNIILIFDKLKKKKNKIL